MGLFRCLSLPNVLFLSNVIALGGDVSKKKNNLSMWPGTCLDGCVVFPSSVVLWYFCIFFLKGVAQLMVQIMWDLREGIWRMIWDLQTHAVVLHLDLPTSGGIPHG